MFFQLLRSIRQPQLFIRNYEPGTKLLTLIFTEMDEVLTPQQWHELQSRIRQQYPELTDTDMQYHEAIEQDMLTMVEYSLRKTHDVLQRINLARDQAFPFNYFWHYSRHNRFRQLVK
jgi:hypothetical protein